METRRGTIVSSDMTKRKKIIYLVGFMGSGKTTVGALLAEQLGWPFIDLDRTIEENQGTTIREIFESEGEAHFRKVEHATLEGIVRNEPAVIALGGGTIIGPENRELIREAQGTTIWLETSLDVLRSRCAGMNHRPLVRDPDSFARLLRERLPEYEKSEFRVATDLLGAPQVVKNVLRLPIF